MKAEDILGLMVPATYFVMLAIEARFPARTFPEVRGWRWLGVACFVLLFAIGIVTPLLLPVAWLEQHRLIDASHLGVPLGVIVGYAVVSFLSFLWHRSLHRFPLLWRLFHQIHHAPKRLDLSSAVMFHPLDGFMFTVVQVLALTLVIGLDPLAAAITGYVAMFYSLFQHWNVKTPRWLGFHASNYADFPLWDLVFGSFRNPARFDGKVGFAGESSLAKMLVFIDVNAPVKPSTPTLADRSHLVHPTHAAAE